MRMEGYAVVRKAEIRKVHFRDASMPIQDMTATRILAGLEELRGLARAGGHDAMVTSLNKAFDTCLTAYVAKKEAELAARIRDAQAD